MQQQNGWSWLDGSAEVSIPTWSKIEVSILSPFVFYLFDVAVVNSFILYKKLENKDLILKEFKICIALKLIAYFNSWKLSVQTIVHPSAPKLKDPTWYLHHVCQFSWKQNNDVMYAPKQDKRTEHLLRVHYVM